MDGFIVELPDEEDKACALEQFVQSLDFVNKNEEFKLVDLQRYLMCGFGTACKVRDALVALCVIEMEEESPCKYRRIKNKKLLFFSVGYDIIKKHFRSVL